VTDVTSLHRGLTSAYQPARSGINMSFHENISALLGFIKGEIVPPPLPDIAGRRNQHDHNPLKLASLIGSRSLKRDPHTGMSSDPRAARFLPNFLLSSQATVDWCFIEPARAKGGAKRNCLKLTNHRRKQSDFFLRLRMSLTSFSDWDSSLSSLACSVRSRESNGSKKPK